MKLSIVLFLIFGAATAAPPKGRIFGGQNATEGQFPFIVAFNDPRQFCDGSIIDNRWILTAAHCLVGLPSNTTVLVGTHIEHSGGIEYGISKVIIHEEYDENISKNDIGLLQIDGVLEYSDTLQPIEIGSVGPNATCTAIGWGQTESVSFPNIVQYVELKTIDFDYCYSISEAYLQGYYLGEEQVCTLVPQGKGACYGDSGGPLVCDGKLAGIVSWGVVPCALGYPDIFTRTAVYADWIQNNIK